MFDDPFQDEFAKEKLIDPGLEDPLDLQIDNH